MIWTDKHTQAMDRTYRDLLDAISAAEDGEQARQILVDMKWPHGTVAGPETPSHRVRRELANLAVVELCKRKMESITDKVEKALG
jgi:hypothetical protein